MPSPRNLLQNKIDFITQFSLRDDYLNLQMNKKLFPLFSILLLTLACNIGVPSPTEIPLLSSATIVPAPIETLPPTKIIPSPTSTPAPLGVFTLAVLVDTTSEPVTREQAQILVDESAQILYRLTGFVFEMVDFQEINVGGPTKGMVQSYLDTSPAMIPNGIILFSFGDNGDAKRYGGYAYTYLGPETFHNSFVAPDDIARDIYIGVVHFGHGYAKCGYGDSDTPISDVSIGGECRGQIEIACVEKYDYQMCTDTVDHLYASTPTYFSSSVFVHEIMHPFGDLLNKDHYGTAECTAMMEKLKSKRPYKNEIFDRELKLKESQSYTGMCPYVFDNFINSYKP